MPHDTMTFVHFAVDVRKMPLEGRGQVVLENARLELCWGLTVKVEYAGGKQS